MFYDLYVSYADRDQQHAQLDELLRLVSREFEVIAKRPLLYFFDDSKTHEQGEVPTAIHESHAFLLIYSDRYRDSEFCRQELEHLAKVESCYQFPGLGVIVVPAATSVSWPAEEMLQRFPELEFVPEPDLSLGHFDTQRFPEELLQHAIVRLAKQIFGLVERRKIVDRDFPLGMSPATPASSADPLEAMSPPSYAEEIFVESPSLPVRVEAETVEPTKIDENVMFTVFRPKTIIPQKWTSMIAFAHLSERPPDAPDEPDPIKEVNRQAAQLLGSQISDYKQSSQDAGAAIPRAGEITFKPHVPGIEFNPPLRQFRWEESVHREEFKMRASADLDGQTANGWLRVYLGPLILAQVNLSIKVDSKHSTAVEAPPASSHARPLRKVFASYSHKDRAVVERVEQSVADSHLGLDYLRDATRLRAGEVWNDSIKQMIAQADMFQLFWSTNSMYSNFVRREYEYALSLRIPSFVLPVYWEDPFPEKPEENLPPEALRRLHFECLSGSGKTMHPSAPAASQMAPSPSATMPEPPTLATSAVPAAPIIVRDANSVVRPHPREVPQAASQSPPDSGLRILVCRKCNRPAPMGRKFCSGCGSSLHDDSGLDLPSFIQERSAAPSSSQPQGARLAVSSPAASSIRPTRSPAPSSYPRPSGSSRTGAKTIGLIAMILPVLLLVPFGLFTMTLGFGGDSASETPGPVFLLLVGAAVLLFFVGLILFVKSRR